MSSSIDFFPEFLSSLDNSSSSGEKLGTLAANVNVWPADDDNDDRVESQLRLGYTLADYRRTRNISYRTKVILVVSPRSLHEPFVSGNRVFRANCLITNCIITTDRKTFKRTADAVILSAFQPDIIKSFLPKPKKQVIYSQ